MKEEKIIKRKVIVWAVGILLVFSFFLKGSVWAADSDCSMDYPENCDDVSAFDACPEKEVSEDGSNCEDVEIKPGVFGYRSCFIGGSWTCKEESYFKNLSKPANAKFNCTDQDSTLPICDWYEVAGKCDEDLSDAVIDSTTNNFTKTSGKWNDGSADYASCNWDDTSTDTDEAGSQPECSSKKDDGSDGASDGVAYGVKETDTGTQSCSRSRTAACDGSSSITQEKACRICNSGIKSSFTPSGEYDLTADPECPQDGTTPTIKKIKTRISAVTDCGSYKLEDPITCRATCALPNVADDRPAADITPSKIGKEGSPKSEDESDYKCDVWSDCGEDINITKKDQTSSCTRKKEKYCSGVGTIDKDSTGDAKQVRTCIKNDLCTPTETGNGEGTTFPVKKYYSCGLGTYNPVTDVWTVAGKSGNGVGQWDTSSCQSVTEKSGSAIKKTKRNCQKISNQCIGPNAFEQTKNCRICTGAEETMEEKNSAVDGIPVDDAKAVDSDTKNNPSDYICEPWTSCQAAPASDAKYPNIDLSEKQARRCVKKTGANCAGKGTALSPTDSSNAKLIQTRNCIASNQCVPEESSVKGAGPDGKEHYSCGYTTYNGNKTWDISSTTGDYNTAPCKDVTTTSGAAVKAATRSCKKIDKQCAGDDTLSQTKNCDLCTLPAENAGPDNADYDPVTVAGKVVDVNGWTSCGTTDSQQARTLKKMTNCAGPGTSSANYDQPRACGNLCVDTDYNCTNPSVPWTISACRAEVGRTQKKARTCPKDVTKYNCKGDSTRPFTDFCDACTPPTKVVGGADDTKTDYEHYTCGNWSSCHTGNNNQTRYCIKKTTAYCYGAGTGDSLTSGAAGTERLQQDRLCGSACTLPSVNGDGSNTSDYNVCDGWNETECKKKESSADAKVRTCPKRNLNCVGDDTLTQYGPCRVCTPPDTTKDITDFTDYKCEEWSFCPATGVSQTRNCVKYTDPTKSNCYGLGVPVSLISGSAKLAQERSTKCTVTCVPPASTLSTSTDYICDGWNPAQCVLKETGQDPQTRICTRVNRNCKGDPTEDTSIDTSNPRKLKQSKDCAKCTTDSYSGCSDDQTTQDNYCPNPSDGSVVERKNCVKFDCKEQGSTEVPIPKYTCDDRTSTGTGAGSTFPPAVGNATLRFIGSPTSKWRADTFLYNSGLQIGIGLGSGGTPTSILDVNGAFTARAMGGLTDLAIPEKATANTGRIYFDSPSGKFKVSENGGNYIDLVGSGSGGGSSQWTTSGSNIYYNVSGGNVGIGTTSTGAYKLNVAGNINASGEVSSTNFCLGGVCKNSWSEDSGVMRRKPRAVLIAHENSNNPTWTWLKNNYYFSVADVDTSSNADQLAAKSYDIYIVDRHAWSVGDASAKAYDLWKKYGKNVITIGNDSSTGSPYPITGYANNTGYASTPDTSVDHPVIQAYRSTTNIGDYGDNGYIITSIDKPEFKVLYRKTGDSSKITGIIGESDTGGIWFHDQTGYLIGNTNGQGVIVNVIKYMMNPWFIEADPTALKLTGGTLTGQLTLSTTDNTYFDLNAGASKNSELRFKSAGAEKPEAFIWHNNDLNYLGLGGGSENNSMFITDTGNVGIGTTIPEDKIEINGNDTAISFTTGGGGANNLYGGRWRVHDTNTGVYTSFDTKDSNTWTNNRLTILSNSGNVGIGTTNPGANYKLDVAGNINASAGLCINGICNTSWPKGGSSGDSNIASNGLVFYVDFNNKASHSGVSATDAPTDLGPKDYKLSLTGDAKFEHKDGIGTFRFDGDNERIEIRDFTVTDSSNTYEAWVYLRDQSGWNSIWDSGAESPLVGIEHGKLRVYPDETHHATIATGKWYHIAVAFNNSNTYNVYVNGKEVSINNSYGRAQRTGGFIEWLGGDAGVETFDGWIAIARAYDKQLSATEILNNYNVEVGRFTSITPDLGIVQSGGNVGIGTTQPGANYKLDVAGNINASGQLCIGGVCKDSWNDSGSSVGRVEANNDTAREREIANFVLNDYHWSDLTGFFVEAYSDYYSSGYVKYYIKLGTQGSREIQKIDARGDIATQFGLRFQEESKVESELKQNDRKTPTYEYKNRLYAQASYYSKWRVMISNVPKIGKCTEAQSRNEICIRRDTAYQNVANNILTGNAKVSTFDGSVGIGTTQPGAKLHVFGTPDDTAGNNLLLKFGTNGGSNFGFRLDNSTYQNLHLDRFASKWQTPIMSWDRNTGNVGIGTTTPGAKLDVVGDIKSDAVRTGQITAKDVVLFDRYPSFDGWSGGGEGKPPPTSLCGDWGMLGGYGKFGLSTMTSKKIPGLPAGDYIIEFDYYKIDSWDNEKGQMFWNGNGATVDWEKQWNYSDGIQRCGEGSPKYLEDVAHGVVRVTHGGEDKDATLSFGSTLNELATNESFGVNNILVYKAEKALSLTGGSVNAIKEFCLGGDCKTAWSQVGTQGNFLPLTGGTLTGNLKITPTSESWAEGLQFVMPTTETWGGLRWSRGKNTYDGNFYIGYTALDATDDLVFGANNNGTRVDNILRLTKAGNVGIGTTQPGAKLHVNGNAIIGSTDSGTSPDSFSASLKLWLKPESIGLTDGAAITTWNDSSGNGNHFTQSGSNRPTYKLNAVNGKAVVKIASGQTMSTTTNFQTPVTVIYLARQTGGTNGRLLSGVNNNWLLGWWSGGKQKAYFHGWVNNPSGGTDTNWHTYSAVETGSVSTVYEDGAQLASNSGGVQGPNGLQLAGEYEEWSDGEIAEVIVFNKALSDSERQSIERYLSTKYAPLIQPRLDVVGKINTATGLCINGDCKTAWSQVGTGNFLPLSGGALTGNLDVNGTIQATGLKLSGGTPQANKLCSTDGSGNITCTKEMPALDTNGNNITLTSGGSVTAPYATKAGDADKVDGLDATQLFNNFGKNHNTYSDFNTPSDFGFRYIQGTANGPDTAGENGQYYNLGIGLGNDYAYSQYAMQFAIPRTPLNNTAKPYPSVRFKEKERWGNWSKIYAGYADSAGALTGNGNNCPNGQYSTGIDASGNAEGCTAETDPVFDKSAAKKITADNITNWNNKQPAGTYLTGVNSSYGVTAEDGNGIKFWNNDAYKIHMGNTTEYHYGPVTDYSIKTNMDSTAGRGWTWGGSGVTPVAAIGNTGNMQIAGNFVSMGNVGIGIKSPLGQLHSKGADNVMTTSQDVAGIGAFTGGGAGCPWCGQYWTSYSTIPGAGVGGKNKWGESDYYGGKAGGLFYGGSGTYIAGGGAAIFAQGGAGSYHGFGGVGVYAKGGENGTAVNGVKYQAAGYFDGNLLSSGGLIVGSAYAPNALRGQINGPNGGLWSTVQVSDGSAIFSGSVGIGTARPGAKLEINYGGDGRLCLGDVGHGPNWPGLANCQQKSQQGYALIQEKTGAYTFINKNSATGYIGFRVANDDKMVINQSGKVGIGIATPEQILHVNGDSEILSTGSGAGFKFRNRNSTSSNYDWVWYSADNLARLWRANIGDLVNINTDGRFSVGVTAKDYLPKRTQEGGNWEYTLLLNAKDTSSIGFHDSEHSVGSIRYRAGQFIIGADDGWGVASVYMPGDLKVENGIDAYMITLRRGSNNYPDIAGSDGTLVLAGKNAIDGGGEIHVWGDLSVHGNCYSPNNPGSLNTGCKGIAYDLAELMPATENSDPGTLVVSAGEKKVRLSHNTYETGIVGVVSTDPAVVMEGNKIQMMNGNYVPDPMKPAVALAGRVPVKVSLENGAIKSGDYLTSSSVPGVAMRATEPGNTVGVALENYSGWGDGTVLVFINIGEKNASSAIKELQKTNEDLQKRLEELEKKAR